MRTILLGAPSVRAVALLTFVGGRRAQTTSSAVLNSLEVQQLITRAEPADHARLEVHFAVLAEQYAADAKRHSAMAQAFIASPIRRTAANSAADHCKRLEQLNLQSAATLRELAAHHEGLAAGKGHRYHVAQPASKVVPAPLPQRRGTHRPGGQGEPARRSPRPPGSTSRPWRSGTPRTPVITSRWRRRTGARESPRRPCIATVWSRCRGMRRRKPPRLRRCTSSLPAWLGKHRVRSSGPATCRRSGRSA